MNNHVARACRRIRLSHTLRGNLQRNRTSQYGQYRERILIFHFYLPQVEDELRATMSAKDVNQPRMPILDACQDFVKTLEEKRLSSARGAYIVQIVAASEGGQVSDLRSSGFQVLRWGPEKLTLKKTPSPKTQALRPVPLLHSHDIATNIGL
jgi:hypothetical protein